MVHINREKNKIMTKILLLTITIIMGIGSTLAQAEGTVNMQELYFKGEVRARYERVDTSKNTKKDIKYADAFTNRLMLGAGSDKLFDTPWLGAYLEMTGVHALDYNYDSTNNGKILYDKVVDPRQSRLTQSYLDIKPTNNLTLRIGRQMLNLDNQRFIGAVGWRQMPQTFNAYALSYKGGKKLNLTLAYVTQINRIFADPKKMKIITKSVVLHSSYKASNAFTLTNYAYLLSSMHNTYGIALTGKPRIFNDFTINYRGEYASQTSPSLKNENDEKDYKVKASYYNFNFDINLFGFLAGAGYEVISGKGSTKGNTTFQTPLATLHAHNGWADQFLNNGGTRGLKDLSFMMGFKTQNYGLLKVIYHDFQAQAVARNKSIEYGKEVDAVYKKKVSRVKGLTVMLKYADYKFGKTNKGNIANKNVRKIWAMVDYKFSLK
jgi:hypothetical protein